jgi:hypothetical protein
MIIRKFNDTCLSESLKYHLENNKPITENIFRPGSEAFYEVIKEARELFDLGKVNLCDIDKELYESTDIGKFGMFNGELVPLDLPMEFVIENILANPHQMMVGYQYKITEPDYDDNYGEKHTIGEESYIAEVIKQIKYGFVLRDIKHNFTFERTFQHLMTCEIEEINVELNEAEYHGKEVKLNYPMRSSGPKKYKVYVKNPKTGRVKVVNFGDVKGGLTAKVSDPKARKAFAARHQCHLKKDKTKAGYWACRINRYGHLWNNKSYPGFW